MDVFFADDETGAVRHVRVRDGHEVTPPPGFMEITAGQYAARVSDVQRLRAEAFDRHAERVKGRRVAAGRALVAAGVDVQHAAVLSGLPAEQLTDPDGGDDPRSDA